MFGTSWSDSGSGSYSGTDFRPLQVCTFLNNAVEYHSGQGIDDGPGFCVDEYLLLCMMTLILDLLVSSICRH